MKELTDEQICNIALNTESAEPGRDGYILPVAFARAVLAAHRGQQDAEIERLLASLHKIASTVPASDGSGGLFFEHHGPDGEYLGCEYVDPMAVIQEIEDIARNAIGAAMKEKS